MGFLGRIIGGLGLRGVRWEGDVKETATIKAFG